MKRIVLWALSTLSALVLLFGYSTSTSGVTGVGTATTSVYSGSVAGAASTPAATPGTGSSTGTSTGSPSTVTGAVAQTEWGPVQVELTVAGAAITKVDVLQYPSGNSRDTEINSRALPILIQETLDAQDAQIDMVSGATVTSNGYLQSLQSAIDQASA
ncbi:MAG: hypothetical protein JWN22_3895 [Nocardioides sp.]|jgi:uncharacterized protein with FMN-binding domain|nr:hypothetical protein [Nocardioides sp.]